ncbi:MAG TPA: DinB family protein [Tepidisphaeraceae bacterium]|nr:DinB family protein [Tepidisphaeraceae bacterium]
MDPQLIEAYAAGAGKLAHAIAGLSGEDFHKTPVAGTWSIGQIIIHMMDSDLIGSDRMKRVIAEEIPTLIGYHETAFSQKLFYEKLDPFKAADVFRQNRELMAVILRNLPDIAFERAGMHSEHGRMTLGEFVKNYVDHLEHHLTFIRKKRAMIGKP